MEQLPYYTLVSGEVAEYEVKVKVTKSLTMVSFQMTLLAEFACLIWSLFQSYREC